MHFGTVYFLQCTYLPLKVRFVANLVLFSEGDPPRRRLMYLPYHFAAKVLSSGIRGIQASSVSPIFRSHTRIAIFSE